METKMETKTPENQTTSDTAQANSEAPATATVAETTTAETETEDLGTITLTGGSEDIVMKRLPRRGPYANAKGRVKLPNGKTRYYDAINTDASRKRLVKLGAYDRTSENGLTADDIAWNPKKKRFVNKQVSIKAKSNKWMIALGEAREKKLPKFEYNGKTYVQDVTDTGMTIYRQKKEEEETKK